MESHRAAVASTKVRTPKPCGRHWAIRTFVCGSPCRLPARVRHARRVCACSPIKDVDLPNVISETSERHAARVVAGSRVFPQDQVLLAYIDVDVLQKGKPVPGPFYVGYRDWKCGQGLRAGSVSRRRPRNWRR
jgi:hypothetical protein